MSKLEEHLIAQGWQRVEYGFGWAHPELAGTEVFRHVVEDAFERLTNERDAALAQAASIAEQARTVTERADRVAAKTSVLEQRLEELATLIKYALADAI